ncbi:hypothetical protein BH10ACT3_BH10ACT3_02060 [soil metagenome]
MAYDPKRPRPASGSEDPPPVDALLGPTDDATSDEPTGEIEAIDVRDPGSPAPEPTAPEPTAPEPMAPEAATLDRPHSGSGSNGYGPRTSPEVPVAPAPEEGTANRAVLAAVFGGSALFVLLLVLWRRRRRDS